MTVPEKISPPIPIAGPANLWNAKRGCREINSKPKPLNTCRHSTVSEFLDVLLTTYCIIRCCLERLDIFIGYTPSFLETMRTKSAGHHAHGG